MNSALKQTPTVVKKNNNNNVSKKLMTDHCLALILDHYVGQVANVQV